MHTILSYPSYWGYELTGVCGAEPTYLGCHTYLWNHAESACSGLVDRLGIRGLPEIVAGSGQFTKTRAGILEKGTFYPFDGITPARHPEILRQPARFWALLNTSLVIQTCAALDRAGLKNGDRVFTEGGFCRNEGYGALLSFALPGNEAFLTNLNEATSFGAAMTAITAYTGKRETIDPSLVNIEYLPCNAGDFPFFERYRQQWLLRANTWQHG